MKNDIIADSNDNVISQEDQSSKKKKRRNKKKKNPLEEESQVDLMNQKETEEDEINQNIQQIEESIFTGFYFSINNSYNKLEVQVNPLNHEELLNQNTLLSEVEEKVTLAESSLIVI